MPFSKVAKTTRSWNPQDLTSPVTLSVLGQFDLATFDSTTFDVITGVRVTSVFNKSAKPSSTFTKQPI